MPPPLLVDFDQVDVENVYLSKKQIYEYLPHAFEFQLLDTICHFDREAQCVVARINIPTDMWWVRGHVPGRPLLPGVLMLEMAAQTSAILAKSMSSIDGFIGFGGVEHCKFRESVTPPAQLYISCVAREHRSRRIVSDTQGICNGKMVFEAQITGMLMR